MISKVIANTYLSIAVSYFYYSVVSIKRTGCNKRTGWNKNFFLVHEKKNRVVQKFFLVHEKKVQGGKKLQNS